MEQLAVPQLSARTADGLPTMGRDLSGVEQVTASFDALFDAEYDGLVRVAYLMLGSNTQAEEAVQDAFVTVYRRWSHLENPGGFARTTVVNRCHDLLRRRATEKRVLRLLPRADRAASEDDYLLDVLNKLDPVRRSMVVLRFYAGLPVSEIAETLGVAEGTVKSGLHRSLATMRKALES